MTIRKAVAPLCVIAFMALGGCYSTAPRHRGTCAHVKGSGLAGGRITDMTPMDYLSHLQETRGASCGVLCVAGVWVKEDHLPKLFQLLDSEQKCARVIPIPSSPHVDMGKPATVGREAGFMIKSFRTHTYPAPLGSVMSEADKDELRKWWEEHRKQKD